MGFACKGMTLHWAKAVRIKFALMMTQAKAVIGFCRQAQAELAQGL